MPTFRRRSEQTAQPPLTGPESRLLGVVARSPGRTRTVLDGLTGGAGALSALAGRGLVRSDRLEVEDGIAERAWFVTDAGLAALGDNAPASQEPRAVGGSRLAIGALVPWFGSARRQAAQIAEATRGCAWVGIPFAGSLCEVPAILAVGANAIALNDAHRHLINLARTLADPSAGARVWRWLRRQPFEAETLQRAQEWCINHQPSPDRLDEEAARHYYVAAWMARSGQAGTAGEFKGGLSLRYGYGGGSSIVRWVSAVAGIREWRAILARCSMTAHDAFDFIARVNDRDDGCVYADPDWPDAGQPYRHRVGNDGYIRLAERLGAFQRARVIVRTNEHPLARRCYRESDGWRWLALHGRNQANRVACEWLIIKNGRQL